MSEGPPEALVRSLVDGPSVVSGVEWHPSIDSTNRRGLEAAAEGVPEVHVVVADHQTAGRGRLGRRWEAPAGTSLLVSLVLRPTVGVEQWPLLPLLTGLVLAEAVQPYLPDADIAVKWPNDLLVGRRKAAGVLAETAPGVAVVGVGLNVDWRGVQRPAELEHGPHPATSLAEELAAPLDRWRLLAALLGVFGNAYLAWLQIPRGFLDAYRVRCATLGAAVRVERVGADAVEGTAEDVEDSGALRVRTTVGQTAVVAAGDVAHLA